MAADAVCIVGAGAAGVAVAAGLRRRRYPGPIVVVGDEPDPPYDRPPLSKQLLAGSWDRERIRLLSDKRLAALGAEWRLGTRAVSVDLAERVVRLDTEEELRYARLVVATGVTPRLLPGQNRAETHVLRSLADAERLRAELAEGRRILIVGAGFVGLEVAATARGLGVQVTVVEPVEHPLRDRLGQEVADRLLALHRERGVRLITGATVAAVRRDRPGGHTVALTDGTRLECDAVLTAIGCRPAIGWLEGSGLELDDGVVCDEHCRAASGVWAAGDVARRFHPGLGRHARFEHRLNANEQGGAVASSMLGEPLGDLPVPFFWTDQYDVKIQRYGEIPPGATATVAERDGDAFVVTFRDPRDGAPVGAVGWNAARLLPRHRDDIHAALRRRQGEETS